MESNCPLSLTLLSHFGYMLVGGNSDKLVYKNLVLEDRRVSILT